MNAGALVFITAFATSALAGLSTSGCGVNDCDCPETPPRPTPQPPLGGLEVTAFDGEGNTITSPVAPEEGTLEVRGDTVVIRYLQAGVQHEVTYAVVDR